MLWDRGWYLANDSINHNQLKYEKSNKINIFKRICNESYAYVLPKVINFLLFHIKLVFNKILFKISWKIILYSIFISNKVNSLCVQQRQQWISCYVTFMRFLYVDVNVCSFRSRSEFFRLETYTKLFSHFLFTRFLSITFCFKPASFSAKKLFRRMTICL